MFRQLLLGFSLWLVIGGSASAQTLSFSFSQGGFDGGVVTGIFVGRDLDGNGQLVSGEITDASMQFSGNGTVTAFSLTFSDLNGLVYDLDGGPLGDGFQGAIEGIRFNSDGPNYAAGPGPFESVCSLGVGVDCAFVDDGMNTSNSNQLVLVNFGGGGTTTNPALSPSSSFTTDVLLSDSGAGAPAAAGQRTVSVLTGSPNVGGGGQRASVDLTEGVAAGDGGIAWPTGVWASLNATRLSNNFVSTSFDSDLTTFSGGVDWFIDDRLLLGIGFGYERQDTETFVNSGNVESTGVSINPYLGFLINDWLVVDGTIGYVNLDLDQDRSIGAFTFDSSTDSNRYFVAANLNAIHAQGDLQLVGTAGVLYAKQTIDGFTESLRSFPTVTNTVTSRTFQVGQWRLGGSAAYYYGGWEPFVSAYWIRDFTRTSLNLAPGVPRPPKDDGKVEASAGVSYYDDSGVTASLEVLTVLGRDNVDSESVNFTVRMDL